MDDYHEMLANSGASSFPLIHLFDPSLSDGHPRSIMSALKRFNRSMYIITQLDLLLGQLSSATRLLKDVFDRGCL